jgi:hypothetical protein
MLSFQDLSSAAKGLAEHPQDHGWRTIYRLFDYSLRRSAPELKSLLLDCYTARPTSPTHLLTLLGIALKLKAPSDFASLNSDSSYGHRMIQLEVVLAQDSEFFRNILLSRQNSFTCARRFLVVQVLLGAYFTDHGVPAPRFADFGTGLGILPRQLNSGNLYKYFSPDLIWPGGIPAFKPVELESIFAMDRGPLPDLDWVRACYGTSSYYANLYRELLFTLADPGVIGSKARFGDLDLVDVDVVGRFIDERRINIANMTYVLYELPSDKRERVLEAIVSHLHPPGLLIVTEPCDELHQQGCIVTLYEHNSLDPLVLCFVSDGHFRGSVIPLDNYWDVMAAHPIKYQS